MTRIVEVKATATVSILLPEQGLLSSRHLLCCYPPAVTVATDRADRHGYQLYFMRIIGSSINLRCVPVFKDHVSEILFPALVDN